MTDQTTRIAELNNLCRLGHDRTARTVITASCLAALTEADGLAAEVLAQAEVLVFATEDGPERARGELILRGRTIRFKD